MKGFGGGGNGYLKSRVRSLEWKVRNLEAENAKLKAPPSDGEIYAKMSGLDMMEEILKLKKENASLKEENSLDRILDKEDRKKLEAEIAILKETLNDRDIEIKDGGTVPTVDDLIREFERGNFYHVNDYIHRQGESHFSHAYCRAVVQVCLELKALKK